MMELNQIYLGDAYELIKDVPDKSMDLIVTDPPYRIEGLHNCKGFMNQREYIKQMREANLGDSIDLSILDEFVRVLKKINVYLFCNKEQIYDYLTYFVKERGCNWEMLIWAKTNPPPFVSGHYLKDKEYCLYFWEKGVELNPKYENAKTVYVSAINAEDKKMYGHPTIKPLDMIRTLIENSAPAGGVILDPFMGSGTTAVAAKEMGRNFIGFEISEQYHRVATDRLKGITKKERESGNVQLKLF